MRWRRWWTGCVTTVRPRTPTETVARVFPPKYTLTRICSVEYTKSMESLFEIIAEPNRRAILSLLVSSQQSVGEIERQLRMPQPMVSKHLRFYTEVLGFAKKTDFSQGPYRWLTVASPEEPDGTELQLGLNNNPAAKAYQQALFQQSQPAAMFFTDDVKGDYERIKARGAEFTMPPTDVTGSTIAMLNDTCGNLIQLTQLARYSR